MSRNKNIESDSEILDAPIWIAKKLFWVVAVPIFMILEYNTQIRPYMIELQDYYTIGLIEGALITLIVVIVALLIIAKTNPIKRKNVVTKQESYKIKIENDDV